MQKNTDTHKITNTFEIKKALEFGLEKTKAKWLDMLKLGTITTVIYMILDYILQYISTIKTGKIYFISFTIYQIIYLFLGSLLAYIITKKSIDIAYNHNLKIKDIFSINKEILYIVLRLVFANILYSLMIILGFIFFIIPGIYLTMRYSFIHILIIDKGLSIEQAFKKSAEMTKNNIWKLIVLSILSLIIMIIGVILLLIGIIPAIMIVTFISIYTYKKLLGEEI